MWAGILLFRILDGIIFLLLANLLRLCGFTKRSQAFGLLLYTLAYAGCFPFPDETIYSEIPELLFRILGFTFYLRSGSAITSGGCFALAILFRQTAVIDLLVIVIHQLILLTQNKINVSEVLSYSVRLLIGVLIPVSIVTIYAYQQGWLAEYWHQAFLWNYQFSRAYSDTGESVFGSAIYRLLTLELLPLFIVTFTWLLLLFSKQEAKTLLPVTCSSMKTLFALTLFAHLSESSASPLWYAHHYIPALMILSLISADTLDHVTYLLRKKTTALQVQIAATVPLILLLILIGFVRFDAYKNYINETSGDQEISTWIQEHSVATDSILVWGYAPQIYLLSERYPASRFHHNLFLSNQSRRFLPLDTEFVSNFRRDVAIKKPKFIILKNREDTYPDLLEYVPLVALEYEKTALEWSDKEISILSRKQGTMRE
jgi:hypothetical protein